MYQRFIRYVAWALLLGIVFVTLSPIGLRPDTGASPRLERFVAFVVLSAAFTLAYPRHVGRVLLLVAIAAVGLELLQLIVPSRDARLSDMLVKLFGGVVGAAAGVALLRLFPLCTIVSAKED